MYDLLSGKLSLGKTKYIRKQKTLEMLPNVKTDGLYSGVVYKDGQFDDSRLAINLAQTIQEQGGYVFNYMEVIDLIKDNNDKVIGVQVEDKQTKETFKIRAKAVINATGVFTNKILNINEPDHGKFVVPSQGIHLVLDKSFLPGASALMIPKTSDGRVLFIVPWHNKLIVGTTDVLVEEPEFEPRPLEKEIDFILQTARDYLVKKPTRADVLSVFAGLRPLAAPKKRRKKHKRSFKKS